MTSRVLALIGALTCLMQAEPAAEMAEKAKAFTAALTPEQRAKACFPFLSDERENWGFVPKPRNGLPLKPLDEAQRKAGIALLHSALSEKGTLKAETIMSLEAVLAVLENNPVRRDPELYYFSIFGEPGDAKGWGWRVEGHHLSINLTLTQNRISATPNFMGTNPAIVREGPKKGTRALAEEEDLARALATTLTEAGKPVIYTKETPADILTADKRTVTQGEAVGVPYPQLTETQKSVLEKLLREYLGRFKPTIEEIEMKRIRDAGMDQLHFAWAGGLKPGEAYYYRIQGPTFLIESANSQNNANHQHTVWRDFKGDFGRDTLGEHYREGGH